MVGARVCRGAKYRYQRVCVCVCLSVCVDGWGTCLAAALYVAHCTHHLYDGLRVSIFSGAKAVNLLTFLSDLAFPVVAGLTLLAHSPDFHLQTGTSTTYLYLLLQRYQPGARFTKYLTIYLTIILRLS